MSFPLDSRNVCSDEHAAKVADAEMFRTAVRRAIASMANRPCLWASFADEVRFKFPLASRPPRPPSNLVRSQTRTWGD